MKAAALLGRFKFGERDRKRSRSEPSRQDESHGLLGRLPKAPLLAGAAVALGLGGVAGWLALNAEDTRHAWEAAIPSVAVPVQGAAAPPPPSTATAAAPAAPAAAVPPPPAATSAPAPAPAPVPAPSPAAVPVPLPVPQGPVTLVAAPVPGLVEDSRNGPLPRIADDGRKPWQVYARPFPEADKRPRIAIVLADMGLSGVTTGNALQNLPPTVTLAFVPFAERLDDWVERARTKGHEVLLSLPLEPLGYPRDDPGPNALLTMLSPDRNRERLEWSLGRVAGYVGVTSTSGSKFTGSDEAMQPLIGALKARGLLFLDGRTNPKTVGPGMARQSGVPLAVADRVIDRDLSRGAIDDQLLELEAVAKANGAAVGFGSPYPSTIERINTWLTGLSDRGFAIAPVSAVVNRQKGYGG